MTVTTKLAAIVVTMLWLVPFLVPLIMEKQSSEIIRVMAIIHVQMLASTTRQRSEIDLVVTLMPASKILVPLVIILVVTTIAAIEIMVPLVIMLVRDTRPAGIMKVPSMMDVVITHSPAEIIKGILKKDLRSVAAPVFVGQNVHPLLGVVSMSTKFLTQNRPMDVFQERTQFSVKDHIVKEI